MTNYPGAKPYSFTQKEESGPVKYDGAKSFSFAGERKKKEKSIDDLQEIGAAPELREFSAKAFKASMAASLMGGEEEINAFKKIYPDAKFSQDDATGAYTVDLPSGKYVMNRPGFSGQDVAEFATRLGAFAGLGPAGAGAKGAAMLAGKSAAIEGGLQVAEKGLGGDFDPEQAAIAGVAAPVGEKVGNVLGGAFSKVRGMIGAGPDASQKELMAEASKKGVDLLATDVVPPNTFIGKHLQQLNEKLGPLGSGGRRASQQEARVEMVSNIAKEFGVESNALDTATEHGIIKYLGEGVLKMKQKGAQMRVDALKVLDPAGGVDMANTRAAIAKAIERESSKKLRADEGVIKTLEDIGASVDGNFSHVANIRSTLIDDVSAAYKGETKALPSKAIAPLQSVKSAIDKDMKIFAESVDRGAAASWVKSNRIFAEGYGNAKQTAIKKLINAGEESPELVNQIIKSQRPSDLKRLRGFLDDKGKEHLKVGVMKKILDDAGYFKSSADEINPDRFATALGKNRKLISSALSPTQQKELMGVQKVLDATRRAQQAAAAPPTGIQAVPQLMAGGAAGAAAVDFGATALFAGSLSAMAKSYESKMGRSLLIKLANAKKGSKKESEILGQIMSRLSTSAATLPENDQ